MKLVVLPAVTVLPEAIVPLGPAEVVMLKTLATKLAVTVQSAVTAPVVYVLPSRLPTPQPSTESIAKLVSAVTVKIPVLPEAILLLGGVIVPLAPAVALTVKVVGATATEVAKVAITKQSAVTAPVVYILPTMEPSQPSTLALKPLAGVTVKVPVLPEAIILLGGLIVPLAPAVALAVKVVVGATATEVAKVAITEQSAVTAPVVYILPSMEPSQPSTLTLKPLAGVTVKVPVLPEAIILLGGLIVPLAPAVALAVKVVGAAAGVPPPPPPPQAAISGVIANKEINNFRREEMLICFFILNPFSFYNFIIFLFACCSRPILLRHRQPVLTL
jgi:hypothetical protein